MKYKWAKIAENSNSLKSYSDDLKTSNFVLCPEGNGIDITEFGRLFIMARFQS